MVEWWVNQFLAKRASYAQCIGTIRKHIIGSKLGGRRLVDVKSGHVEAFLEEKAGDFSAETLNHLRGYLGRAFNVAIRTQRFSGSNPVSKVPKRKIPRKLPDYLRPEEVVPVLANVPDRWRCLFAAALYTGMRKGELLGLRKEDIDLGARLITIRRSHERDTTKGGHADAVPIAAELAPYLEVAMAASKTGLVFPGRDGRLLSRRVQLEQVLRRALRRANILTGYRHSCRRKGCGHVEQAPDGEIRWCPKSQMKLWPVGQVRPIRFHHIRHTTASLLMMAGADLPAVQRIMRHTDPRITTEFYGHLAPGYLRNAIDRLAFEAMPSEPPLIPQFAAPLLQTRKTGDRELSDDPEEPPRIRYLSGSGREDLNLRHPAPKCDGASSEAVARRSSPSQASDFVRCASAGAVQGLPSLARFRREFAAPVLQGSRPLGVVRGGREALLTVRAVAGQLGVCAATVYRLVAEGQLAHVRVLNAIRVAPPDLEAFVEAQRRPEGGRG